MLLKSTLVATCGLAVSSLAQIADVTITASHGGAGNGLTNTTVIVPLGTPYTNSALDTVSYLYLTGANGAALEDITCQAYVYPNGTGAAGQPFTHISPALLSTNTVIVGSLVCSSSGSSSSSSAISTSSTTLVGYNATAVLPTPSSSSSTTLSTLTSLSGAVTSTTSASISTTTPGSLPDSAASGVTSTLLTTTIMSAGPSGTSPITSTITSVVGAAPASGSSPTTISAAGESGAASSTTSAAPGLSTGNAADSLPVTEGAWFALAIAALGLSMAV
ncbi:hypothetical protein LTR56_002233 [Elasticomyces elasticus]|nr:hypothetical protein LTR56_002233 [Elasticomyces elasticus]KAK3666110.1 hypothetical protein LTR22_003116 [Elasticomyces elasticus]KAK4929597.1 hypothetical protein LTR49_003895 [Elasticomyces elasticus]KAK5767446.1 hypothetical protein LTS12_002284 [Elasticomyces elasticus]